MASELPTASDNMGQVIDLIWKTSDVLSLSQVLRSSSCLEENKGQKQTSRPRTQSEGAQWVNRHAAGNRDSGSLNEQVVIVFQLC